MSTVPLVRNLVLALVTAATVSAGATGPTVIHVDDDALAGGDGRGRSPYNNLPEAVAAARATSGIKTIKVAPGVYRVDSTLQLDRSMELRGATVLTLDDFGLPTGAVVGGTETRVLGSSLLGASPLIIGGAANGTVIHNVKIRGFVFELPPNGWGISMRRVQDFTIDGNVVKGPSFFGMEGLASSGRITSNHLSGGGTGVAIGGGFPTSPAVVRVTGNRIVNNRLGAVLVNGVPTGLPELGDLIHAVISDNDLSDNTNGAAANGFGVRLFVLRRDLGTLGEEQASANVSAQIRNNRIAGNDIGVTIDAGFPYRQATPAGGSAAVCDSRVYSGTIEVDLRDNYLAGNRFMPGLVTFTRQNSTLVPAQRPQWQYLHDSTFTIADRQGVLAGARVDHPAQDPFTGVCPNDAVRELLDNVLIYNGALLAEGTQTIPPSYK